MCFAGLTEFKELFRSFSGHRSENRTPFHHERHRSLPLSIFIEESLLHLSPSSNTIRGKCEKPLLCLILQRKLK
uniref:Uncharacterized protein n=1 Tax=Helianthus annuus TaxID=4232 RepID=A0A251SQU2_HELAN